LHSVRRTGTTLAHRAQRLSEGNPTLGLATRREEFALEALLALRNEERRVTKVSTTTSASVDLMVEELLDVISREEMFAVHRNGDGIPDLGDENLKDLRSEQR